MRRFERRVFAVFLIWAFAQPAWSAPQGASEPPASARETAQAPNIIEVTDVIPSSERALQRLNDIRKVLFADDSVSAVEKELPESARKLDEWWAEESKSVHQLTSVQRLNDAAWQLRVYGNQVAGWNDLLTARSKKWSSNEKTRSRLIADWQATQAALDPGAPQAVSNKIREVLNEGNSVQRLYQEKTAQLVAVQGKLTAKLSKLNEIRDEIEALRQNSTVDLFVRDSPPLWTSLFASESTSSPTDLMRDSATRILRDAIDFFHLYQARLLLHLILFLLLTAVFVHLRGFAFKAGREAPTVSEQFILNHCVASAFLVALFCLPLLYPDASPQMTRLILIPAIIPILVLFPAIFGPRLRMALYFLATVYVLDFWRYYLPPQWSAVRILLLIEALLGIAVLYMYLRVRAAGPAILQSRKNWGPFLLKAAMLLFIGSICSNVLGDLTLAEWLFTPLVRTLYLGVVIRALAVVTITFAVMALRTPLLMSLRTVQNHTEAVAAKMQRLATYAAASLWIIIALYNVGAFGVVLKTLENIFQS